MCQSLGVCLNLLVEEFYKNNFIVTVCISICLWRWLHAFLRVCFLIKALCLFAGDRGPVCCRDPSSKIHTVSFLVIHNSSVLKDCVAFSWRALGVGAPFFVDFVFFVLPVVGRSWRKRFPFNLGSFPGWKGCFWSTPGLLTEEEDKQFKWKPKQGLFGVKNKGREKVKSIWLTLGE